jgi:hypothetical protein
MTLDTVGVCTSILAGAASIVYTVFKMVTNHFAHMKQDIIANSDANADKIVTAVQTSSASIVSAIVSKESK